MTVCPSHGSFQIEEISFAGLLPTINKVCSVKKKKQFELYRPDKTQPKEALWQTASSLVVGCKLLVKFAYRCTSTE